MDRDNLIGSSYDQEMPFNTGAYPQQWIIDAEGKIAYAHNRFEYDAVVEILERELEAAGL